MSTVTDVADYRGFRRGGSDGIKLPQSFDNVRHGRVTG
jgi:hypothetical protein